MLKIEDGTVEIKGETIVITAELATIMYSLLKEGFPEEGFELAMMMAKNPSILDEVKDKNVTELQQKRS